MSPALRHYIDLEIYKSMLNLYTAFGMRCEPPLIDDYLRNKPPTKALLFYRKYGHWPTLKELKCPLL